MTRIRNSNFSPRTQPAFAGIFALCTLFGLSLGHAAVTVDQTPLTVKSSLPPNVTLMLDDSGSMQWTIMPDDPAGSDGRDTELINPTINGVYYDPRIRYLPPYTVTAQPNAASPTTTRFPDAAFNAAWYDGFNPGTSTIDIATYKPPSAFEEGPETGNNTGVYRVPRFSHTFQFATSPVYQYANAAGCPSGMVLNTNGRCGLPTPIDQPPYCQGHGNYDGRNDRCSSVDFRPAPCGSTVAPGATGSANSAGLSLDRDQCRASGLTSEAPRCQGHGNSSYNDSRDRCDQENYRPLACGDVRGPGATGTLNSSGLTLANDRCRSSEIDPSCPTGYDFSLNAGPSGEDCRQLVTQGGTVYRSLFVYVDPDDGQRYYVGASGTASTLPGTSASPIAGTCAEVTSRSVTNLQTNQTLNTGVPVANCQNADADSGHRDGSGNIITAGRNIANWFSYYRKRILMAKSGLMNSLATLEPTLRFGFGSINGGYYDPSGTARNDNADRLPSDKTAAAVDTKPAIARVKPFGNGGSGTQRLAFWNWLAAAETEGATPLRRALSAVGAYYDDDDQAWQSGTAENSSAPTTELACRQAYAILMTDGFWNGTDPGFGNEDGPADRAIVRRDGPNQQCFEYPRKSSSSSVCDAPLSTKPYVDARSDTLADVAMHYWLKDLRPAVNAVPTSSADPAFWQHMTTFTVGLFAQDDSLPNVTPSGTTGDDIALWAQTGQAPNNFAWPDPASGSSNNIADLVHAGINGRGGFFSAGNPEQFESGMRRAIQRVTERVGTGASLAANSTRLDTGTTTYQSVYFSGRWRGDVKAFGVDPNTGAIASTQTWSASDRMPEWDDRTIKTYNPSGGTAAAKFPALASPTTLSTAQQTALGADTTEQQNVINYLRGSASQERRNNGTYRDRDGLLGDIISSQPVFVGSPDPNLHRGRTFPGASLYADHVATNAPRDSRLWVAGNDGMLHAFNAAASGSSPLPGAETFAYLPDAVIRNGVSTGVGIKVLTDPNYGSSSVPHQYFNDGELTVSDVYLNSAWKTVLVGSTGRGNARAIYALDITDPAAPSLLWERSAGDGLAGHTWIGQNTGKPVIALVGNPASPSWAVLVGNGYNSSENKAALLQFNLADGALNVHPTDSTTDNGLGQAAVWIGTPSNGTGTHGYAGDLHGRAWSFDLSTATSTGTALYTACGGATCVTAGTGRNVQPITGGMLTGKDPNTGNVWLFFGTGSFLKQADLADISTQTWYGLIVQSGTASLVSNLANGRSALVERSIVAQVAPDPSANPPTLGRRAVEQPTAGDMAGKSGWYMDLVFGTPRGERMVTPNQFQGSLLLGTTRIPGSSDPCNPSGDGWIMAIDPFSGGNPTAVFFDLNNDGQFNSSDMITVGGATYPAAGVGFTSVPNNPIFVGNTMLTSFDNATTSSIRTAGSVGQPKRLSWRELIAQ